jgi:hypothetical protein
LDGAFGPRLPRTRTLVKIDVEGSDMDVIAGAHTWLQSSNLFIIEVHQRSYNAALRKMFGQRGIRLIQIDQLTRPFLGRENRERDNCWLGSELAPLGQ